MRTFKDLAFNSDFIPGRPWRVDVQMPVNVLDRAAADCAERLKHLDIGHGKAHQDELRGAPRPACNVGTRRDSLRLSTQFPLQCWEFQSGPCVDTGECRMSPDHFAGSWSGSGQTRLLTSLEIGRGAGGHNMANFTCRSKVWKSGPAKKNQSRGLRRTKAISLKDQKRAELLRRRIEELDRLLAILNSENEKSSALWKSRSPGFVAWTTPKLWQRLPP